MGAQVGRVVCSLFFVACGARSGRQQPEPRDSGVDVAVDTCLAAPTPIVLATSTPATGGFAIFTQDDTYLYWASDESIVRASKCDGSVTILAEANGANGVIAIGDTLYYTNNRHNPYGVFAMATRESSPSLITKGNLNVASPVTDGTSVFMIGDSALLRVNPDGSTTSLAPGLFVSSVAADPIALYVRDTRILRIPKEGGTATTLATGIAPDISPRAARMLVDDTSIYFAASPNPRIFSLPKTGGTVSLLGMTNGVVADMASDATHVYVAESSGDIQRFARSGSGDRTLQSIAFKPNWPIAIAVDARSIYWLDTAGAVTKLDKR